MTVESAAPTLETIDLSLEDFTNGFPHDVFTVLREQAPVWRHPETAGAKEKLGGGSFWVVSTHEEIKTVSADHTTYRSFEGPTIPDWDHNARGMMLITMDPPDHTRLRKLVNKGFTARMTAMLEDQARSWAVNIIDRALESGECNFVDEVAYKLPMHMIADIVGIPEADRDSLFSVALAAIEAQSTQLPQEVQQARMAELFAYAHQLADRKRQSPADDVWTKLTTAEVEQPDGSTTQLNEFELDLFFMVLTIAGSETTRDSISAGLLALLQNPDQMELLRTDPSVMSTAVDEIVRWGSPVVVFRRTATKDTVLHGVEIKAGERVALFYPSANRDAKVFADPFRFNVTRNPNPHLGFGGHGVHYCLGANLARREIRVMFEELLARTKDIELLGEPTYRVGHVDIMTPCGVSNLPVRLTPR
ncbi:cytochrome P450 [Mycobacterium mantenii]|uniref:Cytochrome P450 n=1 Tax=Mycobacterium mantenii TaxID=560555 RepID=A0ABN6A8W0_MYCNT|nr:cytochrome P450 [Mycobacterium mantenii]MCV7243543.1 cytochrome P450 [Mycobacterium mantenii]BBY38128.1 cytochrome P450 [Mycobacterium mantenii]